MVSASGLYSAAVIVAKQSGGRRVPAVEGRGAQR